MEREYNWGLKKIRESSGEASARSLVSQKSTILAFVLLLKDAFDGGFVRIVRGSGREYFMERSRICRNQEREEGLALDRAKVAWR